jgi:hypothetical protein
MNRLLAYVAQRIRPSVFVPAVLLLAAAACAAAGARSPLAFAHGAGLVAILIVQFRLWDDLEDREPDRLTHPDRVLTQGPTGVFEVALVTLAGSALAAFALAPPAVLGLVALDAIAWWAYRRLRARLSDPMWRYFVLPVKYPAFVVLTSLALGGASGEPVAISAFITYLGACGYEAWHSRASSVRVAP